MTAASAMEADAKWRSLIEKVGFSNASSGADRSCGEVHVDRLERTAWAWGMGAGEAGPEKENMPTRPACTPVGCAVRSANRPSASAMGGCVRARMGAARTCLARAFTRSFVARLAKRRSAVSCGRLHEAIRAWATCSLCAPLRPCC